jgi:ferredoxin-NADP reductase
MITTYQALDQEVRWIIFRAVVAGFDADAPRVDVPGRVRTPASYDTEDLHMRVTHDEKDMTLRVRAKSWEADNVVSVYLDRVDGADLPPWLPGAHVDLELPGSITRQYSLCGSLDDRRIWRVAVLRSEMSRGGSVAIHDQIRVGDMIRARGPRNNFALAESPSYLFIAGGIGITPLIPMIEQVAHSGAEWRLVYGGRSASTMAFLPHLEKHGSCVLVQAEDTHGLLDLESLLQPPREDTKVYCCGPAPLLAAVEELCQTWPKGSLHVEHFTPKLTTQTDPAGEAEFKVVCERSGLTVAVPPGATILDSVREAGVLVPSSCQEGTCGTCETDVVDGLPDHRDSVLTDEERADNDTMMICVGRSLTPILTLDL